MSAKLAFAAALTFGAVSAGAQVSSHHYETSADKPKPEQEAEPQAAAPKELERVAPNIIRVRPGGTRGASNAAPGAGAVGENPLARTPAGKPAGGPAADEEIVLTNGKLAIPKWIASDGEGAKQFGPLIGTEFVVFRDLASVPEHHGDNPGSHGIVHARKGIGYSVGMKYNPGTHLRCSVNFSPQAWASGGKKSNSGCMWHSWISLKGNTVPLKDCYSGAVMATDGGNAQVIGWTRPKDKPNESGCFLDPAKQYMCNYAASGFERPANDHRPEQCDVIFNAPM
jgi:hypothetical protein